MHFHYPVFPKPFTEPPLCRSLLLSLLSCKSLFAFFFLIMSLLQSIRMLSLSKHISVPEHRLQDISDILPSGAPTPPSSHATVFWLPLLHTAPVCTLIQKVWLSFFFSIFLLPATAKIAPCLHCYFSLKFPSPPKKDFKTPSESLSKLFY